MLVGASDHLNIVGLGGHIGSLIEGLLFFVYKYRIIARFCFDGEEIDSLLNVLSPGVMLDS